MRTKLWAVVLVAVGAATLLHTCRARSPRRSELAPEPSAVAYRYPIATVDREAQLAAQIVAIEARVRDVGSPFEMAELADLYFRRSQLTGDAEDYRLCEAMARRSLAIVRYPNPARLVLAKLAGARHEFTESIALARETLRHSNSASAHTLLATDQLALGALADARASAETALRLRPSTSNYVLRALVAQAQGRDADAAHDFARAIAVEEHDDLQESARARALWGRFLIRLGELDGAEVVLDEAARIAPDHALVTAMRGELALRRDHTTDARALFDQAFAISRQVRYLIDGARAAELDGDRDAATTLRAQVETILRGELASGGVGHRLDLVEVLVDSADPTKLAEAVTLARAEAAHRPSADVRFQLARALARTGDTAAALAELRGILATGVHDARIDELVRSLESP